MSRARKKIPNRKEILPDHIVTADSREKSSLATSPATLKQHEKRRGVGVIVPNTVKLFGLHKFTHKELSDLRVDTRYQREEITDEVNELITILRNGGTVPDPISVVERKYGDNKKYIVDGQQRWWAHYDTETSLWGTIYHVFSYEDEVSLFHALNKQRRLTAETRLRSIPGHLGETVRRLTEDANSPLFQKIHFTKSVNFGGMIVARGLVASITNAHGSGGLDRMIGSFDLAYRTHPKMADSFINGYALLISKVFPTGRLSLLIAVALGKACYASFTQNKGQVILPSERQIQRLSQVDWQKLTPGYAIKWLPVIMNEVNKVWPISFVAEKKN